jgi:hypothetical protein
MNSLYYKNSKIIINDRDILNLNKNNTLNNTGGFSYHHNFEKRNNNSAINNNISSKRNKSLAFKSSHQSLKLEKNNPLFVKMPNDYNNNINKNNTILNARKNKLKKDIKTYSKQSLGSTLNHINPQKTNSKKKNLFTEKENIKLSRKKINNYHSISSVVDPKSIQERNKYNSSISFAIKKNNNNEKDRSINKKKLLQRLIKKTESNSDNRHIKDKNNILKKNKNIKFLKNSKMRAILNEKLKNNVNNVSNNDGQWINSSNKRKNNIFFTINKTIINNLNNTFSNTNHIKHCLTNKNNSEEKSNNDIQISSSSLVKTTNDNNNLYNLINLKKNIISKSNGVLNNYNNKKYCALKININDKY